VPDSSPAADLLGPPPSDVDVTMVLADAAQVADGKLYVLGAGLTSVGPAPQPLAVGLLLQVAWDRANVPHRWRLELLDEDGHAAPATDHPLVIGGRFEAGRPAGSRSGVPLVVPLAVTFPPLPLTEGQGYLFQLTIDDRSRPSWRLPFWVRRG
jgi:hypothetical protein